MPRPFNFSAGPATLPEEVLRQAADEMLDWHGSGMSVMEMSHRGKEFISIAQQAEADLRDILAIPSHYKVLFMQGGAIAENAILPMNLSRGARTDYVITGSWSQKSAKEARKYCDVNVAATNEGDHHTRMPAYGSWQLSDDAAYVHVCSNETIHGLEMHELPDLAALGSRAPLVIDCSSHITSRPIDWSRVAVAYGGAQKNIGPAGLTLVIIREDLLGQALPITPSGFNYQTVAEHDSMYNTPPTYAWYLAGLVFQWIKAQREGELTGLAAIEARNVAKASLLYGYIDGSGFYSNKVEKAVRSRMNVPFFLPSDSLNDAFLAGAKERGLLQLKGHKSVGGMRASIYNAMPLAGVQALVDYLKDFAQRHG
ncbi:MAG TPA: 3-phosphoserine/phosphohydroxythreonine transaminase [Aquabacterium sp.]|uniref:3-phosphoserine/phosphohydroxythreonine transaminase n=1 Tax=Aquabacterium sp. TaxID=1872578 RepID=UPI002E2F2B5F|nr:3-phosphoserine/phosphohydroxythreonine transaminase [Aquabacterium sp.]HEX5373650.1 3-phosphoserine/phosphohydroxythreonine transaminase [Aquabacterium sp.]